MLWVVPENTRAVRLYESDGWIADGAVSTEEILGVVVTDLAVLDYDADGRLKVRSVHPGVEPEQVAEATGFEIDLSGAGTTRLPDAEELELIRTVIDPRGLRDREVRS